MCIWDQVGGIKDSEGRGWGQQLEKWVSCLTAWAGVEGSSHL